MEAFIGVLIRRDTFIREYLQSLSADTAMLRVFLEPQKNRYSEEFLHFIIPDHSPVWKLLNAPCPKKTHRLRIKRLP